MAKGQRQVGAVDAGLFVLSVATARPAHALQSACLLVNLRGLSSRWSACEQYYLIGSVCEWRLSAAPHISLSLIIKQPDEYH